MSQSLFPIRYTLGWNGKIFEEKILGIDTETTLIESPSKTPEIVLASVSDGETTIVLKPHEIDSFLAAHSSHTFVCHNAAFDFWVLESVTQRVWNLVESDRFHDTMLLDMLIRLAKGLGESKVGSDDGKLYPQGLGKLCSIYAKQLQLSFDVDKESPYRLKFAELLKVQDWTKADQGFFEYAAADPYATVKIYKLLKDEAIALCSKHEIPADQIDNYGLLTLHIQVKAAIALAKITRNGIGYNPNKVNLLELDIRQDIKLDIEYLDKTYPGLFQRFKKKNEGGFKYTKKSDLPSLSTKHLRTLLEGICKEQNIPIPLSQGKTANLLTTKTQVWEPYRNAHPLIQKFLSLNTTSKLLSFFDIFKNTANSRIYPSYKVLMRTGRTSSSKPNIQQMPGDKAFRSLFIPREGYKFAVIDYSFIELRTLAVICEERFGFSVLADTIRNGIDPHVYTAAMIQNMDIQEFILLKESNPIAFKTARQAAKALNFGIPGGLGAKSLADYAKASYGVLMSKDEAADFRKRLIYKIYPEIGKYLSDSVLIDLARNLEVPRETLNLPLTKISYNTSSAAIMLSNAVRCRSKSDFRYDPNLWNKCWEVMDDLLKLSFKDFSKLRENVIAKSGGMEFHYELFSTTAFSLTGRVRGACTYTQARNTPFQSLAADGAKQALWRLVREKFFPVAFVHDEVVLEVQSQEEANRAKCIMEEEMFRTLNEKVPVECSLALCNFWEK